jgi:hypothetical protein
MWRIRTGACLTVFLAGTLSPSKPDTGLLKKVAAIDLPGPPGKRFD